VAGGGGAAGIAGLNGTAGVAGGGSPGGGGNGGAGGAGPTGSAVTINNFGSIQAAGNGVRVTVTVANSPIQINNSGFLSGATFGVFAFGATSIGIANSGTIITGANGRSIQTNDNATINNTGTIDGTLAMFGSGNLLTNSGLITITNAGTPVGAVHQVNGTFTQTGAGTLALRVDPAGGHDTLKVTGTANLGGTLGAALQAGAYAANTSYLGVVTATNPIATQFGSAVAFAPGTTTPSPFFTVTAIYKPNAVDLNLTRSFAAVAGETLNQRAVALALDRGSSFPLSANGAALIANLQQVSSVKVFDALSGEGITGAQSAAFLAGDMFLQTLDQQTRVLDGSRIIVPAMPSTPLGYAEDSKRKKAMEAWAANLPVKAPPLPVRPAASWSVWGSYFGAAQKINRDDPQVIGTAEFNGSTNGGAFGVDYLAASDLLFGFGVGGSASRFNIDQRLTTGNADGLHIGGYARKNWSSAYVTAVASYSRFDNNTRRTIAGVGPVETATGAFSSDQFGGRLEFGNTWSVAQHNFTPFAAIQALHLRQDAFVENSVVAGSGLPGILGLSVTEQTTTSVPSFLGVRYDTRVAFGNGVVWSPYLAASWVHEFNPVRPLTSSFVSIPTAAFTVDGARPASDSARLEGGSFLTLYRNLSFVGKFVTEISNRGYINGGTAGLRATW